jgi:hypothetical protein
MGSDVIDVEHGNLRLKRKNPSIGAGFQRASGIRRTRGSRGATCFRLRTAIGALVSALTGLPGLLRRISPQATDLAIGEAETFPFARRLAPFRRFSGGIGESALRARRCSDYTGAKGGVKDRRPIPILRRGAGFRPKTISGFVARNRPAGMSRIKNDGFLEKRPYNFLDTIQRMPNLRRFFSMRREENAIPKTGSAGNLRVESSGEKCLMDEKPDYLHVCTSGMRSRENVSALCLQAFRSAVEKHRAKILVDVRELVGDFGYTDIFFLVKEILIGLRGKGVEKAAVIDIHRTARPDWFLVPVAHSYGLNIRVFTEEEPAVEWLKE